MTAPPAVKTPNSCENFGNSNGVEVGRAQDYGFYLTSAGIDGLLIDNVGDDGAAVFSVF